MGRLSLSLERSGDDPATDEQQPDGQPEAEVMDHGLEGAQFGPPRQEGDQVADG
jgi:hypothetical protein